jgi:ABC-type multidrug transport system permease subunit
VAIAARAGMGDVLFAFAALVLTLVLANAIGQWVAAFAGSIAEAALFAAVVALVSLHVSGLFRTPAPGSLWTWIETFSPFSALHDALAAMTHIATAPAGARHALGLAGAATGVMLVIGVTAAAAPLLASRLERAVYAHD